MTKQYKLSNLDCANCARKMQDAINKLDGVKAATVNFMAQKLTIEFDEINESQLIEKISAAIKRIEPDCRLVE